MRKTTLAPALLSILLLPSLVRGDVIQCVTSRKGNNVAYWSQLGPPGTQFRNFAATVSGASPLVVQGESFPYLMVSQEATDYLGDFLNGDYLLATQAANDYLQLIFTTQTGLPIGVKQIGGQMEGNHRGFRGFVDIWAFDKNMDILGDCSQYITNEGNENGSSPYLGIEDLTAPNIYGVRISASVGLDGLAVNTVSITTPGCGVPPSTGGASYKFSDVFASIGTDKAGDVGVVEEVPPVGSPMLALIDGSGAGDTTGTAFDAAGNLYVTNFDIGTISKIDKAGVVTPLFANPKTDGQANPESIRAVGILPDLSDLKLYVGGPRKCPSGACVLQYDSTGTLQKTILVGSAGTTGGTDWIEFLTPDILVYSGEGPEIRAFDITTNLQLPDLISHGGGLQFRVVRSASPGSCGVPTCTLPDPYILVANGVTYGAQSIMIDPSPWLIAKPIGSVQATVIKSYTIPSILDFSLAADPDREHFWTGDLGFYGSTGGTVWQVDTCTGAIGYSWKTASFSYPLSGVGGLTIWGGLGSVW